MNRSLALGVVLTVSFFAVLGFMLTPSFDGKNFLVYADYKFNEYAKASSYFIPDIRSELEKYGENKFTFTVDMKNSENDEKTEAYDRYGL